MLTGPEAEKARRAVAIARVKIAAAEAAMRPSWATPRSHGRRAATKAKAFDAATCAVVEATRAVWRAERHAAAS